MSALSQGCLPSLVDVVHLGRASCTTNPKSWMPNDALQQVDKKSSLACSRSPTQTNQQATITIFKRLKWWGGRRCARAVVKYL